VRSVDVLRASVMELEGGDAHDPGYTAVQHLSCVLSDANRIRESGDAVNVC
jgi:hypothetical protein